MNFTIRPLLLPEDYSPLAELLTVIRGAPVTADSLQQEDSRIPTKESLSRDEDGRLTGFTGLRLLAVSETRRSVSRLAASIFSDREQVFATLITNRCRETILPERVS